MLLKTPEPFAEALDALRAKKLLPTELSTAELDALSSEIRRSAFFSAKVNDARFLQRALDLVAQIVEPIREPGAAVDRAKFRESIGAYLQSIGYAPEEGKEGTLEDLQSDARLNLIVRTNVEMAQGYGQHVQSNDAAVLDAFPCQELFRLESKAKPRDWPARWRSAGGRFFGGGRMIAAKDDDVWTAISRFENPYPPYDFNSGMWTRPISRKEAVDMGVIDADASVAPTKAAFATGLKADLSGLSIGLQAALGAVLKEEG